MCCYFLQEAPLTPSGYYDGSSLVGSCGKLQVLDKMLRKLRVSVLYRKYRCDCFLLPGGGTQSAYSLR